MPRKSKRIHDGFGWYISSRGYPRFSAGPHRNVYIHRYEAAKMLGRALRKDEEVHHGRGGKLDFSWGNLSIKGNREHGWVSARQAFWMRVLDIKAEREFYECIAQMDKEGVSLGL